MHTPTLFVRLCAAVVVLVAPLSLLGAMNEDTIRELKLVKYVEAEFPNAVRLEGLGEGHVALAIGRTAAGEPTDVLVLSATDPRLADAAVEAARQWRFKPSDDPADLVTRTVRIGFRLNGVIVYPFGKKHIEEALDAVSDVKLREPIRVPRVQSLARAPQPLAQPMPAYPASLRSKAIEGSVAVRFFVDQEGRVRLPEVIEATTPEFADAALAAVAAWRYEPPQHGGRNIVASDNWAFQFKANN
ncbi:MAG TPA: TonB family protein [Lacunisphaera sp.]